ncbi:unnamed protein product [Linum trigynum]|uniref:Uncharacterized protein n=1 Tax=Linum trigynum TaxID=586398 RepID=A0AAV2ESZ1_9ROSI
MPAILPISFSLHDAFLHCFACFSPFFGLPFPPRRHRHLSSSVFYCFSLCSATDSPLHFSSAESNLLDSSPPSPSPESSADLPAVLCLPRTRSASGDRMFGLLTNREKLLVEDDEISDRVRSGAVVMAGKEEWCRRRRGIGDLLGDHQRSGGCG